MKKIDLNEMTKKIEMGANEVSKKVDFEKMGNNEKKEVFVLNIGNNEDSEKVLIDEMMIVKKDVWNCRKYASKILENMKNVYGTNTTEEMFKVKEYGSYLGNTLIEIDNIVKDWKYEREQEDEKIEKLEDKIEEKEDYIYDLEQEVEDLKDIMKEHHIFIK